MTLAFLQPERLRAMGHQSLAGALGAGQVAFASREHGLIARLDDGYPVRQGGYGGWEDVARPGQVPATNFTGPSSAMMLSIPIILGHWESGWTKSIEGEIATLERLARQSADAPRGKAPPVLRVFGPVPHGGVSWVIDDLQWGADRGTVVVVNGNRVRANVTVVLRRYVPIDLVTVQPARRRKQDTTRTYKVKDGEGGRHGLTLIVVNELDARGSREINAAKRKVLKLNGLRDGQQIRPGRTLRLPR